MDVSFEYPRAGHVLYGHDDFVEWVMSLREKIGLKFVGIDRNKAGRSDLSEILIKSIHSPSFDARCPQLCNAGSDWHVEVGCNI